MADAAVLNTAEGKPSSGFEPRARQAASARRRPMPPGAQRLLTLSLARSRAPVALPMTSWAIPSLGALG